MLPYIQCLYYIFPGEQYDEIRILIFPLFSFSEFTIYANVTASSRGFPRIIHDGYAFGLLNASKISQQKITLWKCTGSEPGTRKRCGASIRTKLINGLTMMSERNYTHNCLEQNEPE